MLGSLRKCSETSNASSKHPPPGASGEQPALGVTHPASCLMPHRVLLIKECLQNLKECTEQLKASSKRMQQCRPLLHSSTAHDELFTSAVNRGLHKPGQLKPSLSEGLFLSSFAIFHLGRHAVRGARCAEPKLAGCQVWSGRVLPASA